MPYEHFKYTQTEDGYDHYPEQLNARWIPTYSAHGKVYNPDRTPTLDNALPKSWKGYNPKSRRTGLQRLIAPLSNEAKREIRENAASREDFHDIDKISEWQWRFADPECYCELRFITGAECTQHLVKGPDGKTINTPGNKHWAWWIDVAPRGLVCPRASQYIQMCGGKDPGKEGCDIIIDNKAPPEEWVLAQKDSDPEGTPAGRAVSDLQMEHKCVACDNENFDPITNQWLPDQSKRFKYRGWGEFPRLFMEYKPRDEKGMPTPKSAHPLLRVESQHHHQDLLQYPGVTAKDIWFERRVLRNGKNGCYLDEHLALLAAEEAGEDEDDDDDA